MHRLYLFLCIAVFSCSLALPAMKQGKVRGGIECLFWGCVLVFCPPPEGGIGRSVVFLCWIGTLANCLVVLSWLHIANFVRLNPLPRYTVAAIIIVCTSILVISAVTSRAFESVYIGYWLWVASLLLSSGLLIFAEHASDGSHVLESSQIAPPI